MLQLSQQSRFLVQMNKFYSDRVVTRKTLVSRAVNEVCKVVQDILREVESQEPRFISSLTEMNGRYEGLQVLSPTDFEVVLYLSQMGVFNYIDDGVAPGCALLKLSDGRKRSMSLWVEFITASGYLSSRKIRSRFQTLVAQATERTGYRDAVVMVTDTTEVRLRLMDRYNVLITPAFNCTGIWPRGASHWPPPDALWPGPILGSEVRAGGFDLLSKECPYGARQPRNHASSAAAAAEGDAWVVSFHSAESVLLRTGTGCRRRCLSILKTLRDRHLDLPGRPVDSYHMGTLLLNECEKHPLESDWDDGCLGDRVNGILLQLISCLQNRRCPHFFLPGLDLMRERSTSSMDLAAKHAWTLLRELLTNCRSLDKL